MSAVDLGAIPVREMINRTEVDVHVIDQLIYGCVIPNVQAPNVAREVGLRSNLPEGIQAFSVSKACITSNQAITSGVEAILSGQAEVVIAGGVEVLSDIPMLFSRNLRDRLLAASKGKTLGKKLSSLGGLKLRDLAPITPAIAEPSTGETMGQSAERMAKENGIARADQDRWALRSHLNAHVGTEDGRLTEDVVPVYVPPKFEEIPSRDNGIRPDTSLEKLAKLPPVFDRHYGSVTAGNASPLTDGAAAVLLMSEDKAKALGYEPIAYIRNWAYTAISPKEQLLQGPAYAVPLALKKAGLSMGDIGLMEMHEAFAAQVLSNLQALDSEAFAQKIGLDQKVGIPSEDRINVMGGSISIGHPFGATGARLTMMLAREMKRRDVQFGLLTACAAGAMGVAMILERE